MAAPKEFPSKYRAAAPKVIQQATEAETLTFAKVSEACLEHRERNGIKRVGETRRWLEKHVYPSLGTLPIRDISPRQILEVLLQIKAGGREEMAKQCRAYCNQIFRHAIVRGWAYRNPARELEQFPELKNALPPNQGAAKTPTELGVLLADIENIRHTILGAALWVSPYVFVRTSELTSAKWEEIHFENSIWQIPASRTQNKQPHLVPLARQVQTYFEELHKWTGTQVYVFPGYNKTKPSPIKPGSLRMALNRLGYGCGNLINYTHHGFRGIAGSFLREQGFSPAWVEAQLAHGKNNKTQDFAQYIPQRREMLQAWADYLDKLKAEARAQRRGVLANGT